MPPLPPASAEQTPTTGLRSRKQQREEQVQGRRDADEKEKGEVGSDVDVDIASPGEWMVGYGIAVLSMTAHSWFLWYLYTEYCQIGDKSVHAVSDVLWKVTNMFNAVLFINFLQH